VPKIHTLPYGRGTGMRVPNAVHQSRPWRIREIAPDFRLEDVWELPVYGSADDFPHLLDVMASRDLSRDAPAMFRLMFAVRWQLGRWFGWDAPADRPIPGRSETSLSERLPPDLRGTVTGMRFGSRFAPVYRTGTEFAAEISNQTVHAVMHLTWVDRDDGRYQGQMAVYVKPRGRFGRQYMAFIAPFRYWIVYPALLRQIERAWNRDSPP
jgi:hypothetical protein